MDMKLDVDEFIDDYCSGVKDRDILAKHKIGPKDLLTIVKKLMSQGLITRAEYFNRNKKIEELESKQEREFLQSLFHCPVCSHIQPIPFTVCPACGTEMTAPGGAEPPSEEPSEQPPEEPFEPPAEEEEPQEEKAAPAPKAKYETGSLVAPSAIEKAPVRGPVLSAPEDLLRMIGMQLEDVHGINSDLSEFEYHIVEVTSSGNRAIVFKAEDNYGNGPDLAVKQFRSDLAPEEAYEDFFNSVGSLQSAMNDVNILSPVGVCILDDVKSLLYPYYSKNLGALLEKYPDGLPVEMVDNLLRQILNGLGYSHMHRATDGVVRRLPHMNLKLSKFLVNDEENQVKLDDCGVWTSLITIRGHRQYLWQEPGVDLAALAPEAFVIESKFINSYLIDIYALGALLYRLTTGRSPFTGEDVKEYSFLHLKTFPVPPRVHRWTVPSWLDGMIMRCLNKDPAKRWRSATQMELAIGKGLQE
jgi:hypothetical protein